MNTALCPPAIQQDRVSARTVEKLDIALDFAQQPLSAKTRQTHPHILFSPMHYEPKYAYPLLVWLHGSGDDERQLTRIIPAISMRNYVAVAPRGLLMEQPTQCCKFDLSVSAILHRPKNHHDWILPDDLSLVEQRIFDCIAVAQERCSIAQHRIFIAGFGSGGTAALQLAMLYPEYFAGAASFGGEILTGSPILPRWHSSQPLSVLLGSGESPPHHVSRMAELFYMAGLSAEIHHYPDTSLLTPAMLRDLDRWMTQIICPAVSEVGV